MKLNFDLIRDILIYVEKNFDGNSCSFLSLEPFKAYFANSPADKAQETLNYHVEILVEQKLLVAEPTQFAFLVQRLTLQGHQFLATAKDQTIWEKTKKLAGHLSLDIFTTMLKEVAVSFLKSGL